MKNYNKYNRSKGAALIIIIVLVAVIAAVSVGFIVRGDVELACGNNMELKADMDYLAESGLEHAKGSLLATQDASAEFWPGQTGCQLDNTSSDYYDVTIAEVSNLDFQINSNAYRIQNAARVAQSKFIAQLRFNPAVALWSGGSFVVGDGFGVTGDIYCNAAVGNNGSINGDCFVAALTGYTVTGQIFTPAELNLTCPVISYAALIANFNSKELGGGDLDEEELDGSYEVYYKQDNDFEIRDRVTVYGCVAIDGDLLIRSYSNKIIAAKNTPALYVTGDLIIEEGAEIDITGLVIVEGSIEIPVSNHNINITGAVITTGGSRYIMYDQSGKDHHAIVYGDCRNIAGPLSWAMDFDGNGDYIDAGNDSDFEIDKKITVSAFIRVDSFDKPYQAIVTKGDSSWRLQRYAETDNLEFSCSGVTGGKVVGSKNINDGLWHHVAGVYTENRIYIYVDGAVDNYELASGGTNKTSHAVYIGANSEQPDRLFNGAIDSVKVYKRALNSTEIWYIANGFSVSSSELKGFWMMNRENCSFTVNARPTAAAIWHWPGGVKQRWIPAAGAFYKNIARVP